MKRLFYFLLLCLPGTLTGQHTRFAIVVDPEQYDQAKQEIKEYRTVLEEEGLQPLLVLDIWHHPDSIREALRNLYLENRAFEGAVFIGDIPVPMLRDAQHLTSAFKMDQERYPWNRSSVASDRFYEDFDLRFHFLKQDTATPSYFYYSLAHDSPQVLAPEIYSGRIRIPHDPDGAKLRAYLKKVVAAHRETNRADKLLFFAGHGYNSESWTARMDEKVALLQQFPWLNKQENSLEYIDHTFDTHIKYRLLSQLAREDLDLAILHHHGGATAQYLNGTPLVSGVSQSIENIKQYLRSKLRDAADRDRDPEETMQYYMDTYGVPRAWFDNSLDPGQMVEDSIFWNSMDISAEELENYRSNARFIVFDACFNGSFHQPDYLAARYVFGNGKTIAAQANTVNAIQDKFPDEMIGLLGYGLRAGAWNRYVCYMETHIIGDPTFRFVSVDEHFHANDLLSARNKNRKLLKFTGSDHPDIHAWAWRTLYENGYPGLAPVLKNAFMQSPFCTERMEILKISSEIRDDHFIQLLQAAMSDSYELIRRQAAIFAQKSGDPRLASCLIRAVTDPNCSKRVSYQLREALGFFPKEILLKALENLNLPDDGAGYGKQRKEEVRGWVENAWSSYESYMEDITSSESSGKDRAFAIRALRNKTFHQGIPQLTSFLFECEDEDTQVMLLEALGWYRYSYRRNEIMDACRLIIQSDKYNGRVKEEAERTVRRLS
ncbi:MAG: HEAT repeat domain-containing protein [Bacteroidales bacterium]